MPLSWCASALETSACSDCIGCDAQSRSSASSCVGRFTNFPSAIVGRLMAGAQRGSTEMGQITDWDGLRTPSYWFDRAEEARARAGEMRDEEARLAMENIAQTYEALGHRAARRQHSD